MPRASVHTVETAPENGRDPLKALEAEFGKVLDIHGEMAHSAVVLQGYAALQGVTADYGSFGPRTREAITLAVGNVDGCGHGRSARRRGQGGRVQRRRGRGDP